MLNNLWLAMFTCSVVVAAASGRLTEVTLATSNSAVAAAELALHMLGPMALWLGLVRVLHDGEWLAALTRPFARLFARLMPEVPKGDEALGLMTVNMASNVLGLGNAATPFGLKAMHALQRLNPRKDEASDAMVMFLVLNTSGLAVIPTGMIVLRSTLGSQAPGAIFLPTVASTLTAAVVGALAARWLGGRSRQREVPLTTADGPAGEAPDPHGPPAAARDEAAAALPSKWGRLFAWGCVGAMVLALSLAVAAHTGGVGEQPAAMTPAPLACPTANKPVCTGPLASAPATGLVERAGHVLSQWSLLVLMVGFVSLGAVRGVRLYDALVAGGKEALAVATGVLPNLVIMLTAIGMLRASGSIDAATALLGPYTASIGLPAEALPMVLLRPLSGMGSYAVAADIMATAGPDSLAGLIASTLMGTTETTFYVLALYLGAVGIRRARHTLASGLIADAAGTAMAVATCHFVAT